MGDYVFHTGEDWLRWVRRKDRPSPDEFEERREDDGTEEEEDEE